MNKHVVTLEFPDVDSLKAFWLYFINNGGPEIGEAINVRGHVVSYDWDSRTKTIVFSKDHS
ncbi:hypothetical protein LCGC14_1022200 [marine sediment metagenome]|uniref:Uncharacterized protein n=1 Tax=marine sediment metagenome TaxID=412755 RepID=A0A0F9R326_9ZZZZ